MTGIVVGRLAGAGAFVFSGRRAGNVSLLSATRGEALRARDRLAEALGSKGAPMVHARQVHGATVREALELVDTASPPEGDAVVCRPGDVALGMVFVADCLPVALGARDGGAAAIHAGWRGLLSGVIQAGAEALADGARTPVEAVLGAGIGPCCYEFGPAELAEVVQRYGPSVGATTTWGTPSLDLRAAARSALAEAGVPLVREVPGCTACSEGWFSWRRGDTGRQALVVRAAGA